MINIIIGALFLSVWAMILFFGKNIGSRHKITKNNDI